MTSNNGSAGPPALVRDEMGDINTASLADVIEWFLTYDQRAAVIRHPKVEEIFHWKQQEAKREGEDVYQFAHAEDRLAIGIMQALAEHGGESDLHAWISQLLNALDDAVKTNEEMAEAYNLKTDEVESTVKEALKIPTAKGRKIYLTCCWIEVLCTAEVRIMGWIYKELHGKPFAP